MHFVVAHCRTPEAQAGVGAKRLRGSVLLDDSKLRGHGDLNNIGRVEALPRTFYDRNAVKVAPGCITAPRGGASARGCGG